jgi:hypothetical protein
MTRDVLLSEVRWSFLPRNGYGWPDASATTLAVKLREINHELEEAYDKLSALMRPP